MHPLSIFPELLSYGFFAPLVLRVVVSFYIIYLGKKRLNGNYKWSSAFYFISGVLVFLGLYTQIAVIVAILTLKIDFYFEHWKNRKMTPVSMDLYFLYFMSALVLLTLIFTGPGAFAFDLPL